MHLRMMDNPGQLYAEMLYLAGLLSLIHICMVRLQHLQYLLHHTVVDVINQYGFVCPIISY